MTESASSPASGLQARRHAESAMADLEAQTGDEHSSYYTQGLTNWIPTLAEDLFAALDEIEGLRDLQVAARSVVSRWREVKNADDEIALLDVALSALKGGSG